MGRRRAVDITDAQRLTLEMQLSEVNRLLTQLENLSARLNKAASVASETIKRANDDYAN